MPINRIKAFDTGKPHAYPLWWTFNDQCDTAIAETTCWFTEWVMGLKDVELSTADMDELESQYTRAFAMIEQIERDRCGGK